MSYLTQGIYDIHELERRKNNDYLRMLAMQQQGMPGLLGSSEMGMQQALRGQDIINRAPQAQGEPEKNPKLLLLL